MKMAQVESATRIVLAFYEAFNRHDVAGMERLLCTECVLEEATPAPDGAVYEGKEAIRRLWETFFNESTRARLELEDIFGFRLRCVARWRAEWTDAAGASQCVRGVDVFRVKDDLICEKLSYTKG